MFCLIDFETASACDLKKSGAWKYAEDPTTEILCLGYSIDGATPVVVRPEHLMNMSVAPGKTYAGQLERYAADPACLFIAHNCGFEKAIWRRIMVEVYGWPDIPNSRWHDSQAVCAQKALPIKLEKAAAALRLGEQKDTEGTRVTVAMSKTNKRGFYERDKEKLQRVYAYNAQDVRAEVELNARVGGLQPCERNVWLLDQRINERGVQVDLGFVAACQSIVDQASVPLIREFKDLTGGVSPSQRDKVLGWVRAQGVELPNLQKATLTELLGARPEDGEDDDDDDFSEDDASAVIMQDLPARVRRALEIRRTVGSSSIKKLAAIRNSACADGRVRGVVQYHGAGTGRWVGRLFQPQNFPRGSLKVDGEAPLPDAVVAAIMTHDPAYVEMLFGEPVEVVISALRHAIIASEGRQLVVGDFATIEARIVLALAGQHDKTELMRSGRDIYIAMAEAIYKRPIDKKRDPAERQVGKNSVLGLGFQMGWAKFKSRYAPDDTDEFAKKVVDTYRSEFAPQVPELWYGLEKAAIRAVHDRRTTAAYGLEFAWEDIWLTMRLPSGRKLYYAYPEACRKAMPWDEDDVRPAWTCRAWKLGRWVKRDMYGGLITENAVQAIARDLMVEAMFKAEKNNLPLVLTVHDELVADVLLAHSDPAMLRHIMEDRPKWASDLQIPVGAECWAGERYKK